jgi:hypothetical protein
MTAGHTLADRGQLRCPRRLNTPGLPHEQPRPGRGPNHLPACLSNPCPCTQGALPLCHPAAQRPRPRPAHRSHRRRLERDDRTVRRHADASNAAPMRRRQP